MIRAEVRRHAGRIEELRVQGHAETGAYGEDLVCAAASAIVQTALLGLRQVAGAPPAERLAEGDVLWRGRTNDLGQAILETCVIGLQDIAQDHPAAITVEIREAAR